MPVGFITFMAPVALITDFGTTDWYAGALKGSVLTVDATIPVIDITHDIPAGDIRTAAFTLANVLPTFPERTVFCTVVDPGVRTGRRALAASVKRYFLVGPDNGLFSYVVRTHPDAIVRNIENTELLGILSGDAETVLQRHDLFGLAAGFLASRGTFSALGAEITDAHTIPFPQTTIANGIIATSVIMTDRFGNIITAAENAIIKDAAGKRAMITIGETEPVTADIAKTYPDVGPEKILVYPGSGGYMEIALNGSSARDRFAVAAGTGITISVR